MEKTQTSEMPGDAWMLLLWIGDDFRAASIVARTSRGDVVMWKGTLSRPGMIMLGEKGIA